MNSFQSSVLYIAIVILIITLLIFGFFIYSSKNDLTYPPVLANCPDYWLDESIKKNGSNCKNSKNLGKNTCSKIMDFSTSWWSGQRGLCNKSKWAKACNLTWDGITSNNDICKS